MNKTEQEFFEKFGIEPLQTRCKKNRFANCAAVCFSPKSNDENTILYCPNYLKDGITYPPITPEIVLALEDILLKKYIIEKRLIPIDKDIYNFEMSLGIYDEIDGWKYITNLPSHNDCILDCCTYLKDEIQDQVKELFNEK